jgi:hypothetical protein
MERQALTKKKKMGSTTARRNGGRYYVQIQDGAEDTNPKRKRGSCPRPEKKHRKQAEPPKGLIIEFQWPQAKAAPKVEPVEGQYHDDLSTFFKQ